MFTLRHLSVLVAVWRQPNGLTGRALHCHTLRFRVGVFIGSLLSSSCFAFKNALPIAGSMRSASANAHLLRRTVASLRMYQSDCLNVFPYLVGLLKCRCILQRPIDPCLFESLPSFAFSALLRGGVAVLPLRVALSVRHAIDSGGQHPLGAGAQQSR